MRVLVVGNGGREHALAWKINQSPLVERVYSTRPNAGLLNCTEALDISPTDVEALVQATKDNDIAMVVVGPEAPLVAGLADALSEAQIPVVGPSAAAAHLEGSKAYSKALMEEIGVPTAQFATFTVLEEGLAYLKEARHPLVVKASGLAAGKGVIICESLDESEKALRGMMLEGDFGGAGAEVVVEEFLVGEEASLIALCSGEDALPLASSQDHKRLGDGDTGLNTGGMGAYSPAPILQGAALESAMELSIRPILKALADAGTPFYGFLYAGLMLTEAGAKVLEYNVRLGDPETQAILPRIQGDLVPALLKVAKKESLAGETLEWDPRSCVCIVAAAAGYPVSARKGDVIDGLDELPSSGETRVFHAGTTLQDGKVITSGGRVLSVVALGDDIRDAIAQAYDGIEKVQFSGMQIRSDIGAKAI